MKRQSIFFIIVIIFFSLISCDRFFLTEEDWLRKYGNPPEIPMVSVPSYTFNQSANGVVGNFGQNQRLSFDVKVDSFKISKFEISYGEWYKVMKKAESAGFKFISKGKEKPEYPDSYYGAEPTINMDHPVVAVTWADAVIWCNAYSIMSNLEPLYYINGEIAKDTQKILDNNFNIECKWGKNGYRLPTESEWHLAAAYKNAPLVDYKDKISADNNYIASDPNIIPISNYCIFNYNSNNTTASRGKKKPNMLGIYDMSGNVFEWCWDWRGLYPEWNLGDSPVDNYRGPISPTTTPPQKIIMGGAYDSFVQILAIGYRNALEPSKLFNNVGFRIVKK